MPSVSNERCFPRKSAHEQARSPAFRLPMCWRTSRGNCQKPLMKAKASFQRAFCQFPLRVAHAVRLIFTWIFRVLNTVQSFIFKVHGAVSFWQLIYYTTFFLLCQQLFLFFQTFWSCFPISSPLVPAALSIIANLFPKVNSFLHFFQKFCNKRVTVQIPLELLQHTAI